jgi:hypothetical protein
LKQKPKSDKNMAQMEKAVGYRKERVSHARVNRLAGINAYLYPLRWTSVPGEAEPYDVGLPDKRAETANVSKRAAQLRIYSAGSAHRINLV